MNFDNPVSVSVAHPSVYYAMPIINDLNTRRDVTLHPLAPSEMTNETARNHHGCMLLPPATILNHGPFRLLPGVGICAEGNTGSERLVTDTALTDIDSILVHPNASHLAIVLQIICIEMGMAPVSLSSGELSPPVATLYSGDEGLAQSGQPGHDIGTLWMDLTGLPLVLGVWACPSGAPYRMLRTMLGQAKRNGESLAAQSGAGRGELHYTILSRESESLHTLYTLAVKHGFVEANEEAIVFC